MLSKFPCCRERRGRAPKINQSGFTISHSIDDPLSGHEDEDDAWFGGDYEASESSGSDMETDVCPVTFERKRANAVSAEAYGASNPRRAFTPPIIDKTPEQETILREAFQQASLFQMLSLEELKPIVAAMTIDTHQGGDCICRQGDPGDALYVLLSGGVDLYKSGNAATESAFPSPDNTKDGNDSETFLRSLDASGTVFGELALLWNMPRSLTVKSKASVTSVMGRLGREVFQHCVIQNEVNKREHRQQNLRSVKLLETLSHEQIAKLADALKLKIYNKDDNIITQGEMGREFFILTTGECKAIVATYFLGIVVDDQEHRRYHAGELFGERAVLRSEPRSASITACVDDVQALVMSRGKFERLLGPLAQLQEDQYLTDPRKLIADFYQEGDANGPAGSMTQQSDNSPRKSLKESEKSQWFAVYRPTSRDAIAKMLSKTAVGKGLNVKGKSSKKGLLSGFVPFLQISDNDHKDKIEASPKNSRITLYFRNSASREIAQAALYQVLFDPNSKLDIENKKVTMVDKHKPAVFGLDIPEPLLVEAYIMRPDIVPRVGWETGRASEPAFMDMNLHAVRGGAEPTVCLYQFDEGDPMNPRGLLIAYAEEFVKPVVSDFDTFTVGSKGVTYEPLPANQATLAKWSLDRARGVIEKPTDEGWTPRWLGILKEEAEKGFHPEFPKYGFGDPTSYRLIGDVVTATLACGAVRHGAECFNFYFPQELDNEYLVVWEGFPDKPWEYQDEKGLRKFLLERIDNGFIFPLNPVWAIRDKGWYEVLQAMRKNPDAASALAAWDPPGAGLLDAIEEIHKSCPDGFTVSGQPEVDPTVNRSHRATADMFGSDILGCEKADLGLFEVSKLTKKFKSAVNQVRAVAALTQPAVKLNSNDKVDETLEAGPVISGPSTTDPEAVKGFV